MPWCCDWLGALVSDLTGLCVGDAGWVDPGESCRRIKPQSNDADSVLLYLLGCIACDTIRTLAVKLVLCKYSHH